MCGRYAAGKERDALALEFEVDSVTNRELPPRWNIAPTAPIYIVRDEQTEGTRTRLLEVAMWGLVPRWATDMSIGAKMANARCETVASKPSFRVAFARHRCLVPVEGWYEWAAADMSVPSRLRRPKQPYFFQTVEGADVGASSALAGIYEWWQDPADQSAPPSLSAAIITTDAYGHLAEVHNRTPVLVGRDQWDAWLDPNPAAPAVNVLDSLLSQLQTIPVKVHPVSTRVNSARNELGPELIAPIDLNDDSTDRERDGAGSDGQGSRIRRDSTPATGASSHRDAEGDADQVLLF